MIDLVKRLRKEYPYSVLCADAADRIEQLEAERDRAWNEAIEAASSYFAELLDYGTQSEEFAKRIRSLAKEAGE